MLIHYHPNPLCSVVELDVYDVEKMRLKLIIEDLQERVYGAHFALEKANIEAAMRELDIAGLEDEPFNKRLNQRLELFADELRGVHYGDCTCVPCSCAKCYAESLLDIDTIPGLGKHSATKIEAAFRDGRSLDEAIVWLDNYKPERGGDWLRFSQEDFDRHVPRWTEEAKEAAVWLREYRDKHFSPRT